MDRRRHPPRRRPKPGHARARRRHRVRRSARRVFSGPERGRRRRRGPPGSSRLGLAHADERAGDLGRNGLAELARGAAAGVVFGTQRREFIAQDIVTHVGARARLSEHLAVARPHQGVAGVQGQAGASRRLVGTNAERARLGFRDCDAQIIERGGGYAARRNPIEQEIAQLLGGAGDRSGATRGSGTSRIGEMRTRERSACEADEGSP